MAIRPRASVGGGESASRRRLSAAGAAGARDLFRGAGMAVFYPWPPHNQPLLDERSRAGPALAAAAGPFDEQGVDVCYEIHPAKICTMA